MLYMKKIGLTDIFKLKIGQIVFNAEGAPVGVIADIRETSTDYIEAFLAIDNSDSLVRVTMSTPYYVEVP